MNLLISVAMATYNGEKYLKEQLDSIFNQTYKNIEVIICDDCSNDKTVEILEEYRKKSNLKYFINKTNLGFKRNFEKAISLCNGSYISLADQDDIWLENKIEVLLKNINDFSLIHSACSLIDNNSKIISPLWRKEDNFQYSFTKLIFGNTITGCTVLFKKELLKDSLPIPSQEKYHDWWLALMASKQNGIVYCDEVLVQYRQHSEQDTGANTNSFFSKIQRYVKNFLYKKTSKRYSDALEQSARLNSFLNEKKEIFTEEELNVIRDAINYEEKYLNNFFHLSNFFLSLKYHKEIYPSSNFYIKNIIRDLIG